MQTKEDVLSGPTDDQVTNQAPAEEPAPVVAEEEPKAAGKRRAPKAPAEAPADGRNLLQRIAAVMAEIDPPGKKGTAPQGWAFARWDDMADALRPLLAKHGVIMLPSVPPDAYRYTPGSPAEGSRKAVANEMDVDLELTIFNADDPADAYVLHMPGQGFDFGDKVVGKAVTYAMKNLLVNLFQLRGGEDNEASNVESQRGGGQRSQQQRQQTASQRQRDAGRDQGSRGGQGGARGAASAQPATQPAAAPAGAQAATQPPKQQTPALRWFWKVVREQEIAEEVVRAYLQRNYGLASTGDLSDDQVKEMSGWAQQLKGLRNQLLVACKAARIADDALAEKLGEWFGGATVDVLTVDELEATIRWAENQQDGGDLPWSGDSVDQAAADPTPDGEQGTLDEGGAS